MSEASTPVAERAPDLVLARLHLRLGSLSLARAELETLAGKDLLDAEGVVDLIEARWRTGDLIGAAEAAALVIDDDEGGPVIALVVAAEAAAARGRPTEARRLAAKALAGVEGSIDDVFKGMPRSPAWPPDPAAPPPSPTTMFDAPHPGRGAAAGSGRGERRRPRRETESARSSEPPTDAPSVAEEGGLWDASPETASEGSAAAQADDTGLPTGEEALEAGRRALEAGDIPDAALQLALVLRLSPALAPAVIELLGEWHDPALAFVRGDAYRLVGRELEARRAYADAARPATPTPTPQEGDPA